MADIMTVKHKYCDRCENSSYCYKPCALVYAALWDLPSEKEIYEICKKRKDGDRA